ncbi:MAG: hypothetical protein EPN17_04525 [Methylobacter sp.]|nr:MAG: hypothetical protein EPN17_04525 [Methylobacter sp.]
MKSMKGLKIYCIEFMCDIETVHKALNSLPFIIFMYFGLVMAIILGIKRREWAWGNNEWESVEHFNRVQKKWSFWDVLFIISTAIVGILAAIAIPAYQDYVQERFELIHN